MDDLNADGNAIVLVDHDTRVLEKSDWIIEMDPEAGTKGSQVIVDASKNKAVMNIYLTGSFTALALQKC